MKELRFIDGFSEGGWKSLVVKSLRLGWPEGLRQAEKRLAPSTVQRLLLSGIFEDTWPTRGEFAETWAETKGRDWEALCARETLHGRGYAEAYCSLPEQVQRPMDELYAEVRRLGFYLPGHAAANFEAWLVIDPKDEGKKREVDEAPWRGMPAAMLDSHTFEGRRLRTRHTILTGSIRGHRELGEMVMKHGWSTVRHRVHFDGTISPDGEQLRLELFTLSP